MATPRSQRIGIWIIAIVLTIGTLGSFLVMVLSINNQAIDNAEYQKQYTEYLAEQKKSAQTNADNSESFSSDYSAVAFDAASVTELQVETLVQGTGETVSATDSVNVSYFGWTADGVIFDSSKKKDATADSPATFALSEVITGWTEGLTGLKIGSVVKLTIPADKAYGTAGSGIISADSPLQFIIKIHSIDNSSTTES